MQLVVDANVLIAAFLRSALTRELLLHDQLSLATPEFGLIETRQILRSAKMLKRLHLSQAEFDTLWTYLVGRIDVIARVKYQAAIPEARRLISDPKDAPYVACALTLDAPVWSNDPHFQEPPVRQRLKVFKTSGLIAYLRIS